MQTLNEKIQALIENPNQTEAQELEIFTLQHENHCRIEAAADIIHGLSFTKEAIRAGWRLAQNTYASFEKSLIAFDDCEYWELAVQGADQFMRELAHN